MTNESSVYITNLKIMRAVVSKIQNMQDPDVDALVPLVEEGLAAKKKCVQRIEAVEHALGIKQEDN